MGPTDTGSQGKGGTDRRRGRIGADPDRGTGMKLEFLGSGGNSPIPTPTCRCEVCAEARTEGIPYARRGNSMYLHDLNALIDAPEYAFSNLNRAGIDRLEYVFLTHWHPDHVNGLRVVQFRDLRSFFRNPDRGLLDAASEDRPTLVTTRAVYERTCETLGSLRHFVEAAGFADTHFLDEEPLSVGDYEVSAIPYPLEDADTEPDATAFVVESGGRTLLIASDDARYLDESRLPSADLAVFECGLFEALPDGTPLLTDADRSFLADELRHEEVIKRIERVDPERAVLTEIEHLYARGADEYARLEADYDSIRFAYDGLVVEL
jgi:phosphoribosyl 1,2-cyclic phosphate phosphodiesterase